MTIALTCRPDYCSRQAEFDDLDSAKASEWTGISNSGVSTDGTTFEYVGFCPEHPP